MITIISDTLSPKINQVAKKLETEPSKFIERMLKFARGRARLYARGKGGSNRTHKLERGIGYRVYKKSGKGILFAFARGNSSKLQNYALWVNKDIPIRPDGKRYFKSGQGYIYYGQKGVKSPSGKEINWNLGTVQGFFTQALIDTNKMFEKHKSQVVSRILK